MVDMSEQPRALTGSMDLSKRAHRLANLVRVGWADLTDPPASVIAPCKNRIEMTDAGAVIVSDGETRPIAAERDLAEAFAEAGGSVIDLVFRDDSCIDLSFRLPDSPLPDLERMIDTEIQFRSPFNPGTAVWIWVADELPENEWHIRAAVALKGPVQQMVAAAQANGLTISTVRRDGLVSFAAKPAWAVPRSQSKASKIPQVLRLPLASLAVFMVSAIALIATLGLREAALNADVAQAQRTLSSQATLSATRQTFSAAREASLRALLVPGALTDALPDDVWLEQLVIDGESIVITGYGPSAADVSRILSTIPSLADIRFVSPVTRDNSQNLERFRLAAGWSGEIQ